MQGEERACNFKTNFSKIKLTAHKPNPFPWQREKIWNSPFPPPYCTIINLLQSSKLWKKEKKEKILWRHRATTPCKISFRTSDLPSFSLLSSYKMAKRKLRTPKQSMMGRGGRPIRTKGKVNATGNVTLSRNRATSPLAIASELEQQPRRGRKGIADRSKDRPSRIRIYPLACLLVSLSSNVALREGVEKLGGGQSPLRIWGNVPRLRIQFQ